MSKKFRAIVTRKSDDGKGISALEEMSLGDLPDGDVLVRVSHAALNYKDGLALGGLARIIRDFPFICGIDFTGVVERCDHADFQPGDRVIVNGWRIGEVWWGGFADYACLKGEWLMPIPHDMSNEDAATMGVAGLTAGIAINRLEAFGLKTGSAPVLVTGASGGVGSFAIRMLSRRGYEVAAVSGRPENEAYLRDLGAGEIIPRSAYEGDLKKPLSKERWSACIDNAGGGALAQILAELHYGGAIAAIGLAAGSRVEIDLVTMFVRNVSILGIDTAQAPKEMRQKALDMVAETMRAEDFARIRQKASLADVPDLGRKILKGQIKGRAIIDLQE